ncbi:MAG: alpha/beta fold hydrolase [Bdellovibrionota bacterium]
MSFLTTMDANEIYYSDLGRGDPVVLIHGWPLNADMWEYQVLSLLEQGFRVITYDRRGFGRSSKPANGYNYDVFASDLNQLIEQLDLHRAALVGFSMGGGEIARYLSQYDSSRIARVMLISSVVPYLFQAHDNPEGVSPEVFDDMIVALREDRPAFLANFARLFFGMGLLSSPVSEETLAWTSSLALQASLKATIDCVRAFSQTDFRNDVRAIQVPTLLVHGTSDKVVPISATSEVTQRLIPHATLKRYDGAPHGLIITDKEELNRDMLAFFGRESAWRTPETRIA